ncbi:MAG: radical SAM family heme chaperone HemW [Verrucomicrobia bacterium]|nr:radical SAM family heme chaperone HemW [Verrucomicrobiota bacterium]
MSSGPVRSLYIHVPFCAHKCEYCAFYSAPPGGDQVQRYVQALVRELELIAPDCRPETIFFGGGTPSLLTLAQWETVLESMHRLGLTGAAEWTVECNPATVSADKARLLRSAGVNRISMGVQSFDDTLLERLGRIHTRQQVYRSVEILRAAGFDNLNLDLMFAIPGQTLEVWSASIGEALRLGTEHLSCYEVIYEEDTPLYEQLKAGAFDVDEDLACAQYDRLVDQLAEAGFRQYEIANFARDDQGGPIPSRACRHNVGYWRGRDSHGLGPSASEYVRGVRSRNWANTPLYCEHLERGRRAKEFAEALPPLARAGELAAFGLRMTAGWPYAEFRERTGFDLRETFAGDLAELARRGWGEDTGEAFRLTRHGLRFADAAGACLLRTETTPA